MFTEEDNLSENNIEISVNAVLQENIANFNNDGDNDKELDVLVQNLSKIASEDTNYKTILNCLKNGFSTTKSKMPQDAKPYWNIRNDLSIDSTNNLIIYNGRIVVPKEARRDILKKLHASHQGAERTKRRARQILYWPCMNSDITNMVSSCEKCHSYLPSQQKEPLKIEPLPSRVFQEVSIDFFACSGINFLLQTDRLSGWPITIYQFGKGETTAKNVIIACRRCFADVGVPTILRSDCGPQFTSSEFFDFLSRWGVTHKKSTPYYPQSNGLVEAAVKSIKKLILTSTENGNLDTENFQRALLEWRNTPREGGLSPAQIVFGHPLRSFIPAHHSSFDKKFQTSRSQFDRNRSQIRNKAKKNYDLSSKPLPKLEIEDHVWIQNPLTKKWDTKGIVTKIGRNRDYLIETPSGKMYWRNRRFIRK